MKALNRFINLWGGAVPLYILSEEGFNRDMALFMILGILNSLFVTLFLYGREKNWRKTK